MMKRGLIFGVLFILILAPLLLADETEQIQKAYQCLDGKTNNCAALNTEQKAFSLLALDKCETQLKNSASLIGSDQECWRTTSSSSTAPPATGAATSPSSGSSSCNMVATAKAALALESSGVDSVKAAEWLLAQRKSPPGITWLLQIESNEATSCSVVSSKGTDTLNLGNDKKVSISGSSQCFSVDSGGYWFTIKNNCYQETFEISCNKGFLTNLLYRSVDDPGKLFVSGNTQPGIGGGSAAEININSFCMGVGSVCDYQATLWAAITLDYMGFIEETDSLIPYLETEYSKAANVQYLPEAFLYNLLGDNLGSNYRLSLLNKQKTISQSPRSTEPQKGYWQASTSTDKFYDTALATLFISESEPEFQKAKNYLVSSNVQNSNGCWGSTSSEVIDTAFILHSLWPDDPRPAPECTTDAECVALLGSNYKCNTVNNTCVPIPPTPFCGDGIISGNESCDGSLLNGKTCANYGSNFTNGTLSCYSSSSQKACTFDTSGCTVVVPPVQCNNDNECNGTDVCIFNFCVPDADNSVCGNGVLENGEECDGNDWGNFTRCTNFPGRVSGNITCIDADEDYECTFDLSACVPEPDTDDDDTAALDCEDDRGYFCRSSLDCTKDGGNVLSQYDCSAPKKCCDIPSASSTCGELGGDICSSNQDCSGTPKVTSDLRSNEICCLAGICEDKSSDLSDCENEGGVCRSSCLTGESTSYSSCLISSDYCCVTDSNTPSGGKKSYTWLWILLILAVLTAIVIIFRDKFSTLWMRIKSKFSGSNSRPRGMPPGFPPSTPPMMRSHMPNRILPPQENRPRPMPPRPVPQKSKDLDEVLKKLKDMGK